ncbi:hypothetical protein P9209_15980 [Prescottella defluvii]|nr:hypothetical protein P9209_15980 [Prescottella defluvii]
MRSAADLAAAITETFVEVVHAGDNHPVRAIDIADAAEAVPPGTGDLVLAVGFAEIEEAVRLVQESPGLSGLVVRRGWASSAVLQGACREARVTLLALTDGVTWSVVAGLFRDQLDAQAGDGGESIDHVYGDLFDLADLVSVQLQAPVTIEDAASKVVAYSTGQDDVDAARTSSIFGRRVPRHVRDHFRSLGVFRRLSQGSEPFFVPGAADDVRGRFIVPVRAGGEWLGSVWAVVDKPREGGGERELKATLELIALHLLKMRSRGELTRQLQLDQTRAVLQGTSTATRVVAPAGPSRVVVLRGPERELEAGSRRELWIALARRRGWRLPVVTDLDGRLYSIVAAEGQTPGSWTWLANLVESEVVRRPGLGIRAGSIATGRDGVVRSRHEADELDDLEDLTPVIKMEERWPRIVLHRALRGLQATWPVSPLGRTLEVQL